MSIPEPIEALLKANHVDVANTHLKHKDNMPLGQGHEAQLIILADGQERLQFMLPCNALIDLQRLFQLTKRHYRALDPRALQTITHKLAPNIKSLPALPQATSFETWVDEQLLKLDTVSLHLDGDQLLEVSQADFRKLIGNASIKSIASPLPELSIPIDHWQEADLKLVNNSVSRFTSMRIKQRLDETLDVPPLPEIANEIIQLRMKPDAETQQLSGIVGRDPSLSAQVISWANSPYYGVSNTIHSIQDAVIRVLGFDLVINLSLGLALGRDLTVPRDGPYGYTPYWKKAVYMAHLVAELGAKMPSSVRPPQGLCYLSGLLHNFGYLILAHVFPPMFDMLSRHIEANPRVPRACIEKHLLGITREQLASGLFKQWHLPQPLCIAIRYQNHPYYEGEHAVLSKLLNLSLTLLHRIGISDGICVSAPDDAFECLQLPPGTADEVIEKITNNEDALNAMINQLSKKK
jgi:HD-like signal output (HDOD) protein